MILIVESNEILFVASHMGVEPIILIVECWREKETITFFVARLRRPKFMSPSLSLYFYLFGSSTGIGTIFRSKMVVERLSIVMDKSENIVETLLQKMVEWS